MQQTSGKKWGAFGWGIFASVLLHLAVVGFFLVKLPVPAPQPEEETVSVDLVPPPEEKKPEEKKPEEKPPEIIRPVLSVVIEPRTTQIYGFAGSVEPQVSADLAFRLLGRVVSRDVKVGDIVSKGTTIATLDPTALELAVQAARAELSNAEAQFTNAAASEDRQRQLLAAANTSQAVFDAAQQARQAAEAGVERAKAALAKSQEQLGYARLFSDFDGVVTATGA